MNRFVRNPISHLMLIALTGCSQTTSIPVQPSLQSSYSMVPFVPNASNPYDWIGRWHNKALDFYINHMGTSAASTAAHLNREDTLHQWWKDSVSMSNYHQFGNDVFSAMSTPTRTVIQNYQDSGYFSTTVANYMRRILDQIDSLKGGYDSASFVSGVKAVETDVLASMSPTDSTRSIPLGLASLVRGSFSYWLAQSQDPSTLWPSTFFSRSMQKKGAISQGILGSLWNAVKSDGHGFVKGVGMAVGGDLIYIGVTGASGIGTGRWELC